MKTSIYRTQRVKKNEHKCEHKHGEKAIAAGMFRYFEHKSRGKNEHFKKKTSIMRQGLPSRVISACWILKWWVSTANRSAFVVLICRQVLTFCTYVQDNIRRPCKIQKPILAHILLITAVY